MKKSTTSSLSALPALPVLPVKDAAPPLRIQSESEVFHERGGADFAVTESIAAVRATGDRVQFHTASIRNGKTGAVCIVERVREDNESVFLIARHWRVSTKQWAWEFPRGMVDDDEIPAETAVREVLEETGLHDEDAQVTVLQHMHADTGVLRDDISVSRMFLPRRATGSSAKTDWELTNMRWITADTIWRMIGAGEISDGITLAAWAIYCARFAGGDADESGMQSAM